MCILCGLLGGAASSLAQSAELSFERLNRDYEAFLTELEPIEIGPARVFLESPSHRLSIISHRATLLSLEDGSYRAELQLRFSGAGTIEAEVLIGTVEGHLEDELVVPEQQIVVSGRVTIERVEEGYTIRALELPSSVTVQIESRLAKRLFSICRPMSLVLVSLDCDLLERALTFLDVPLPAAESYLLPNEELTVEDHERLQLLLAANAPSRAGDAEGRFR